LIISGGLIGASAGASLAFYVSPRAIVVPLAAGASAEPAPPVDEEATALAAGAVRRLAPSPEEEVDEDASPGSDAVWDLGARDLNGDERPDLVIVTGGPGSLTGRASLVFDPGVDAPPASWPSVSLETTGDYGRVAVGDIDGDGIDDVAALTFGTHLLRWWLLAADHSVLDERSMSFAGAELPGRVCPGPPVLTTRPLTLSSLAFADLDVDGALELAVTGYAGVGEGGLCVFSYRRASGCFELVPAGARSTRGSLKVRFFDVDDDGTLDVVTSHYALARPRAPGSGCGGGCLEWGEWWKQADVEATPLLASFENVGLAAADPTPELNVVDFDALRDEAGARFALAGSAHLCPAFDCWSVGRAGFVSVIDGSGRLLASGDDWKQQAERSPPLAEARLVPRVVSFFGELERPSLAAGYWWATRSKNTACSRVNACAGPLTARGADGEPRVLDSATFVQSLAVLSAPGAPSEHVQHCLSSAPLLALPDTSVTSIIDVRLDGRVLADGYSWVPGSRIVALARQVARAGSQVCVRYAKSSRERLAVADSKRGLLVIPLE
jgi:hypothetical protein